ncbi:MAG: T9SS type A sorting domain-containing protein, partial [Candidatus Eisenbacteria bacterium]|nr:T9SS type A sorting domain-containing protein [Candidatus Eisenbacteria bacterium]
PQYSAGGGDATYCGSCHGNFRAGIYISATDGMNWGNLHDLHRNTMLNGDCNTCHSPGGRFPVILHSSTGGSGLDPISCVGCHGRAEDNVPENPEVAGGGSGYGAGLRQHHFNTGTTVCATCHLDADPANYTVAGEDAPPRYYANPGSSHPAMPTGPCNSDGSEDFAGIAEGLDNDGDDVYDGADSDCTGPVGVGEPSIVSLLQLSTYPNPSVGSTSIALETPAGGTVDLRIFDIHGRTVRSLAVSAEAGRQLITWDGRDDTGRDVPNGIYLLEARIGRQHAGATLVLVRG